MTRIKGVSGPHYSCADCFLLWDEWGEAHRIDPCRKHVDSNLNLIPLLEGIPSIWDELDKK